jgi:hypothetical protein
VTINIIYSFFRNLAVVATANSKIIPFTVLGIVLLSAIIIPTAVVLTKRNATTAGIILSTRKAYADRFNR